MYWRFGGALGRRAPGRLRSVDGIEHLPERRIGVGETDERASEENAVEEHFPLAALPRLAPAATRDDEKEGIAEGSAEIGDSLSELSGSRRDSGTRFAWTGPPRGPPKP